MKSHLALIAATLASSLCLVLEVNARDRPAGSESRQGATAVAAPQLKSRSRPGKPEKTLVQPWHESDQILVKFAEGSKVRRRQNDITSLGGADLSGVKRVLARYDIDTSELERRIDLPETQIDEIKSRGELRSGRELADLNTYFSLSVPDNLDTGLLCDELNSLPVVELAEPLPRPASPPEDIGEPTGDYSGLQGYRAFVGITDHQGVNGINGAGIAFVDIEYDWLLNHEDLGLPAQTNIDSATIPYSADNSFRSHGTSVLGIIVGGDNGYGVTGLASAATPLVVPASTVEHGFNIERAISLAILELSAGDAILIELQANVCGVGDYGPVEWYQSVYDAIETATANGIIVVEAAGNGAVDLDVAECQSLFDPAFRDSGAIIVGAGRITNRARLFFSSYGSRVDVQGWGLSVVTTGNGDFGPVIPEDPREHYTRYFSGTSSASAIVTGTVLAIQGARNAMGLPLLAPEQMRQLLIDTGTPQTGAEHIGPLPDVAAALMLVADPYDDFIDARQLPGPPAFEVGSNVNATKESGEPLHAENTGGASVWWSWSPVSDGLVTINTFGSSFNTLLSVYTGTSVDALNLVAQDDDTIDELGDQQSQVVFATSSGENYFIAVDGYNALQGEIRLNMPLIDRDGDGVYDHLDNCASIANPGQEPSGINPHCGTVCETSSCSGVYCVNH